MLAALQQVQAHAEGLTTQLSHAQATLAREREAAAAGVASACARLEGELGKLRQELAEAHERERVLERELALREQVIKGHLLALL